MINYKVAILLTILINSGLLGAVTQYECTALTNNTNLSFLETGREINASTTTVKASLYTPNVTTIEVIANITSVEVIQERQEPNFSQEIVSLIVIVILIILTVILIFKKRVYTKTSKALS